MKKITTILLGVFATLTLAAQPPIRHQGERTLPNQFRDFVTHQQRLNVGRPQIEKKDGKVIITMSEEQFKRMQQIREVQRFRMTRHRIEPVCQRCEKHHGKPHRRKS